jgi:hypothetical protein
MAMPMIIVTQRIKKRRNDSRNGGMPVSIIFETTSMLLQIQIPNKSAAVPFNESLIALNPLEKTVAK